MFKSQSSTSIEGEVLGQKVRITVVIEGPEGADASPVPAEGRNILLLDSANVQTVILSEVNHALMKLQHMEHGIEGLSPESIRTGRVATPPAKQREDNRPAKILVFDKPDKVH